MKRRDALGALGAVGLLGVPPLAGCLEAPRPQRPADFDRDLREWRTDVTGWIAAVSDGWLVGGPRAGSDGVVFGVDVATGDHRWTYPLGGRGYTFPAAVDGTVYFGKGNDTLGGGGGGTVYAIEFDGTERWTRDTASVRHRPIVEAGVVYVGGDDGVVRALDAGDGEPRWRTDVAEPDDVPRAPTSVIDVGDAVFASAARRELVALREEDGDVLWRYAPPDGHLHDDHLRFLGVDDVAYLGGDPVVAVSGGEEAWRSDHGGTVVGVDSDRVYARADGTLRALDAATGAERWRAEDLGPGITVHPDGDALYVQGDRLHAFGADDGTERWRRAFGDLGPLQSFPIARTRRTGVDRSVFVAADGDTIYRITPDGSVGWSETVGGEVGDFVVDGFVYANTTNGVYSLDPR